MTTEYWCERGKHWVHEIRCEPMGEFTPRCEPCVSIEWNYWKEWLPIVREVKELRYVDVRDVNPRACYVWDTKVSMSVDVGLTESEAREIAALRNKWEEQ